MEFRILGSLGVVSGGLEVQISGAQRRAVLALLLVHANRVVSADALADDLWHGLPPRSASTTLQTYVYQLRKTLEITSIQTRPTGYLLAVEPDDLDALRFERAVETVRGAQHASAAWVSERLRTALGWWRGSALSDFAGLAWAQPEAARLETLRLGAVEDLVDARLALGEHVAVVPELESFVAEHPLRERLWAQLMLALYRSNRQADALRAYSRLRATLGDELGIEPGRDVTGLETAILRHDPTLDLAPQHATLTPDPDRPSVREEPAPRHRSAKLAGAVVAAIAAAVVAGGIALFGGSDDPESAVPAPSGYRPKFRSTACPPFISNADSTARCGELTVPEERTRPHGRSVRLGVYRFPARVAHPTADPIVQVPGDFRLVEPPADAILRSRSDSIYLAGRGFFGSHPRLTCPGVTAAVVRGLSRRVDSPESKTESLAAVKACNEHWRARGVHLASYSSAERAADVRDLAFALRIPKLNLLAGRDSTREAREVAGRFPGLVRSVLLLNVTPPQGNRWNGAITNAAGAFDRYVRDCSDQPACVAAYPDLPTAIRAIYDRNQSSPTTYMAADPRGQGLSPIPVLLDGDRTVQIATFALDDPGALPLVAAALAAPGSGQAAVDFGVDRLVTPDDASWGALLSKLCIDEHESLAREGLGVEASASPMFAAIAEDPLLDACTVWRVPGAGPKTPSPAATPTLILQGELDPFTSTQWAEATARAFGRATVVQLPHLGDVAVTGDPCVTSLRMRFLAHPERRVDPRACRDQIEPVDVSGA
jgi:DNA-binding SARP family transcriptional activator/pimeloyl-ACP methyl ester carboxylesterase